MTFFIFFIFHVLINYTVFGRNYLATGGNARASFVAGINTNRMIILGFMVAGILSAIAGMLTAGRQDSVSNTMGNGMTLLAFAGALLGGTSMSGGKGSAFGMLGGAILLGMFSNALNLLGVKVTLIHAAQGTLIFLAILVDRFRVSLRSSMLRKEQIRTLHREEDRGAEYTVGNQGRNQYEKVLALGDGGSIGIDVPVRAGASEKKLTVGLVVKEPTAPYIQAFMKAAEEKAGELGSISLSVTVKAIPSKSWILSTHTWPRESMPLSWGCGGSPCPRSGNTEAQRGQDSGGGPGYFP